MNYRHAFHAGNHADVLKHLVLLLVLRKLVEKDKPFVALDLFAGQGLYDLLLDERVARTGEWRSGLGRIVGREDAGPGAAPEAVETYRRAVRAFQNGALEDALRWCPGSPALIRDALRGSDRLVAVERHPEEAEALRRYLRDDARARVAEDDGWLAVKALTPPTPRRGVALIDPPFEKTGEFDRMLQALGDGLRRWATGIYLLWHPVKDLRAVAAYERGARRVAGDLPCLLVELSVRPRDAGGLIGSGLVIVNPPYGMAEMLEEAGPWLADALGDPTGAWRMEWLVPPR